MQEVLINYRCPPDLKMQFDSVCKLSRQTRTQVLIELMRSHLQDQLKELQDRRTKALELQKFVQETFQKPEDDWHPDAIETSY